MTAICAAVVLAVSRIPLGHDSPYEVFSVFRSILVHSLLQRRVGGDTSTPRFCSPSCPLSRTSRPRSPPQRSVRINANPVEHGRRQSKRFGGSGDSDAPVLQRLLSDHVAATGSPLAGELLAGLDRGQDILSRFTKIIPVAYARVKDIQDEIANSGDTADSENAWQTILEAAHG